VPKIVCTSSQLASLAGTTEITGRVAVMRQILLPAWDVVQSLARKCHMFVGAGDAPADACGHAVTGRTARPAARQRCNVVNGMPSTLGRMRRTLGSGIRIRRTPDRQQEPP